MGVLFTGVSGEGSCDGGVVNISISGAAPGGCLGGVDGGRGVLVEGLFVGFVPVPDGDSG